MQNIHNLNLQLKCLQNLKLIDWRLNLSEFNLSIDFDEINKIELYEDSVLYIQFENGEMRFDITKKDLDNIKEV